MMEISPNCSKLFHGSKSSSVFFFVKFSKVCVASSELKKQKFAEITCDSMHIK